MRKFGYEGLMKVAQTMSVADPSSSPAVSVTQPVTMDVDPETFNPDDWVFPDQQASDNAQAVQDHVKESVMPGAQSANIRNRAMAGVMAQQKAAGSRDFRGLLKLAQVYD